MSEAGSAEGSPTPQKSVEKIMTLSQSEFAYSIGTFAGEEAAATARRGEPVVIGVRTGKVVITFTRIEGFSFGGLVEMPRARVVIEMHGLTDDEAGAFLRRFDISFQRGGG